MKILTKVGSKERFLEMYQRVNKIQLNEEIVLNNNSNTVLENAFQELKNNQLNIKETNNQLTGNENFSEVVCTDKIGNNYNFKFKATSTQEDQDGVFNIDSAQLNEFTFNAKDGGQTINMDNNALKQFNAQHEDEIIDVAGEFFDTESEQPEVDELYEEAIKKIDSYPFGAKDREGMQTLKAYADEKPTNPKLRVNSPELDKYVSEIQEYNPEEEQSNTDTLDLPPDYNEKDIPQDEPDIVNPDNVQASEPSETISPEKEKIIFQAYDNLIAAGISAPTTSQIMAEIDKINPTSKPIEKSEPDSHMATGKKRVYPSMAEPFLENAIQQLDPTNIVSNNYEQLSQAKKEELIKKATKIIFDELGTDIHRMPNEDYKRLVKTLALQLYHKDLANLNETDYPQEMGISSEIKTSTNYPKPKKKHKTKKLKIKTGISENTDDQAKYENIVFLQGDNAYQPLEILDTKGKDAALEYLKQWHYKGEHMQDNKLGHGSGDQIYEKDGYIMSWNPSIGYIGLQYDLSNLTENEEIEPNENPEATPELNTQGDEENKIEKLAKERETTGDILQGGVGAGKSPLEFDMDQVIKGLDVEKEHSQNPLIALAVTIDHLSENPDYYTVKDTPQDSAQAEAAKDAEEGGEENNSNDEEMTDVLLGYEPKNVGDNTNDDEIPAIKEDKESELKQNDPATWHQIQIAKKTIKMPGAMANIMGGMTKEEAREILAKRGIKVDENMVGASGAEPVVGSNSNNNTNDDGLKKYQEYQKKDFNSLKDNEKQEYFGLWNQYKDDKNVNEAIINVPDAKNIKLQPGVRVKVVPGSGLDSDKVGIIVSPKEVRTNGSGIPINIQGAYKPIDWNKEFAVKLDDGELITMFKNRLYAIDNINEIKNNPTSNIANFVSKLDDKFKNIVLKRESTMGMDGAIYFTLGEYETKLGMFHDLDNEDEQEAIMELIIQKFPELEF